MNCSLHIIISNDNFIQCSITTEENKEEIISLNSNENEESQNKYPCVISFTQNQFLICQKHPNQIEFMKEWKEYPNDYKKYSFQFQGKQHEVISEVLFALIMNELRKKIGKKYFKMERN